MGFRTQHGNRRAKGAINILWAALRTINTENDATKHYPDFNQAILVCLPQKPTITTADGTQAFHSNNTRPLAISNTDNRLLAAACRIRWEGLAKDAVHQHQRGFLPGRSMLANITEIDHIAHIMALEEEDPTMVLYDFTAAFPSISRHYTLQALEAFGAPRLAITTMNNYYNNKTLPRTATGTNTQPLRSHEGHPSRMSPVTTHICYRHRQLAENN